MLVKMDHFPKVRGENKKCLKPPPSLAIGQVRVGQINCISKNFGSNLNSAIVSVTNVFRDGEPLGCPRKFVNGL